jgi:hypothetical protein
MNRNRYATQGRCIIEAIKRRPMTYMQMLALGVSTCPWRRVAEGLREHERLIKREDGHGHITWRVVEVK